MVRHCLRDPSYAIPHTEIEGIDDCTYVIEPIAILDENIKVLETPPMLELWCLAFSHLYFAQDVPLIVTRGIFPYNCKKIGLYST